MADWIADVKDLITQLEEVADVYVSKVGADDNAIKYVQEELGVVFPKDYKEFLKTFGLMAIYESSISGISGKEPTAMSQGTVIYDTKTVRKEFGLAEGLAVVEYHEGDYCLCLDLRGKESETESCPILEYNIFKRRLEKKPIHASYENSLIDRLKGGIEAYK